MFQRERLYKKCLFLIFLSIPYIHCNKSCWSHFDAEEHFDVMDKLDERYAEVKSSFNQAVGNDKFDKDILAIMLKNRGKSERAIHEAQGDENMIPAGINLGGYCIMKMPQSLLFFHRMKLRNNTVFRITNLKSNLADLTLKAHILLNDLHLFGSYDFTNILSKRGILSYDPTFGQIELLLKNVSYNIEGRYRLLKNKLNIELIISEIDLDGILMMYRNKNSTYSMKLDKDNIDVYITRLKVDLNKWLKDYLNDYLMYYVVAEDAEFEKYNQEKTKALNQYADGAIDKVLERVNEIQANAVQLPVFEIHTMGAAEIKLRDGVLRGLDSIYRRAITTGTKQNKIRSVDTVVGFSNLKLSYRYDVLLNSGLPAVTGVLTLTADDLTAHMQLLMTKYPPTADLSIMFLEQAKPESLTVEGPGNRMISNFKYMLERHILALMTNTLVHNIHMLSTLDRCVPIFAAFIENQPLVAISEDKDVKYNSQESKQNKHKIESKKPNTLNDPYDVDTGNTLTTPLQKLKDGDTVAINDEIITNTEKHLSDISYEDNKDDKKSKSLNNTAAASVEFQTHVNKVLINNKEQGFSDKTSQDFEKSDKEYKNQDSMDLNNNKILIGYDVSEKKKNLNKRMALNIHKHPPYSQSKRKQRNRFYKDKTK